MPRKSKPEPWEGDSSDDWEPEAEENLDGSDLLSSFGKKETEGVSVKTEVPDESQTSRKRGRREKKKNKNIEEIEKPRGVDRGLQPEKILAAQLSNSSVYFLVKWQGCLDVDVVPGKDLNQHFPEFVIKYYESCVPMSVRYKQGRTPREAPELQLPPPELPPVPMDVSENLEPPPMPSLEPPAETEPAGPGISMPDMSLPDMSLSMPEVPAAEETQPMEVPVN